MQSSGFLSGFTKTILALFFCLAFVFFLKPAFFIDNFSASRADSFLLGGIHINESNLENWANNLKRNGFNTAEVTVYARQNIWNSDDIKYAFEEDGVINEIEHAKAKGLKVALILRVTLDHKWEENKFLWHGMIMPKNDSLIKSWFAKYEQFVLQWALVASNMQVDYFAIGSELNSMTETIESKSLPTLHQFFLSGQPHKSYESRILKFKDQLQEDDLWVQGFENYLSLEDYITDKVNAEEKWATEVGFVNYNNGMELFNKRKELLDFYWRNIIAKTKFIFRGKVSFAANFDSYNRINFWDDLDYISINAYFKLRNENLKVRDKLELEQEISNYWLKHLNAIQEFKAQKLLPKNMGVVFSELGYVNKRECSLFPWKGFGFSIAGTGKTERLIVWDKQPVDLNERAMAIGCLSKVVLEKSFPLKGVLYWKLTSHKYHLPYEPFGICIGKTEFEDPSINALKSLFEVGVNY